MPNSPRTHRPSHWQPRKVRDAAYERRRRRDPKLALSKKIRSSRRWQAVREHKRRVNPLCEICEAEGKTTPMRDVHHRVPLLVNPSLAYDIDNLQSLCRPCHARAEREAAQGDSDR